jgi:hypothetical protein
VTLDVKRSRDRSSGRAAAAPGPEPAGRDDGWREPHALLMRIARAATPEDFPRREFHRALRQLRGLVIRSKRNPDPGHVHGIVTVRGVLADEALMAALLELAAVVGHNPLFAAGDAARRLPDVRRKVAALLEAAMSYSSKWP